MKKNKLLIIGKIPPPTGGVTIHVSRIIDKLFIEGFDYSFEVLKVTNLLNLTKSVLAHKNIHLHANNPYVHFLFSLFTKITGKILIITLHAEFGQHKTKLRRILESFSLRLSTIPIVLNVKSFNLVQKININVILDSAYIKPIYQKSLPKELDEFVHKKRTNFKKIFCTNAYNRVYDINGNELYGIDELVKLFEKTNFLLIVCDPSGVYSQLYNNKDTENTYFINYSIDFVSLLIKTDGFIRNTTTDGDSISIHEAISNNVAVYCTSVVDRPEQTILYKNAKIDLLKLLNSQQKHPNNKYIYKENKIFNIYKKLNN
jgi:hypothetical protein